MSSPNIDQYNLDQFFMEEALRIAEEAAERGEVPVGAVVIRGQEILARASNRVEELRDALAHAEVLALREAARIVGDWRLSGCTLYVTKEPCFFCAGAILLTRVTRVVFGVADPKMGGLGGALHVILGPDGRPRFPCEVEGGVLAERSLQLLQDFFRALRRSDL
ncbi:nucleoside deaminase [Candidatus Methylacidithermus pantelleriae]|uniref:tRNA-specific adenosine deaminase n=1 Tax=Candidatus Methylacidithermus pantelleriae TaxID=2744239 RepID=A0A8J2FSG0_9BACT|nr:nucleoside deaminase [Candidatus Methylacidithermus pantelleriae]CAF0696087.1 tRNA-specific adenosine deaminase [Candidatus Methylacidithermus pantelleriae]